MSIRKVLLPSGESKYEVRLHANGRGSKRTTRRFDRKSDAEAFELNFKREMNDRRTNPFKQVEFEDRTFGTEAANWFKLAEIRFSFGNVRRVRKILEELVPKYGHLPVSKMTPEIIAEIQLNQKAKGLEDTTVNRKVQVVIAILNFAVKQRRIPYNPAQGYTKLKEAQKEQNYWSAEEAQSFLSFANDRYPKGSEKRWIYVSYLVALNTGIRAGELWGLQEHDLSPFTRVITVRRQLNRLNKEMTPTKSRKGRMVPCSKLVAQEINEHLSDAKRARKGPDATIFQSENGGPIDHDNFFDRVFMKDLKAWGGKRIRFHDMRHTATTLMISSGVDLKTVKEICGHADIATTMNYVHLVASQVEKVPELFSLEPLK